MAAESPSAIETLTQSAAPDRKALDGSEIRLLANVRGAGMAHCTLPPGAASLAVVHKTVEEIWYFTRGRGEVMRRQGSREEVVPVAPGISLNIPLGTQFQFRNTGPDGLEFVIATVPPWPEEEEEAIRVPDYWPAG